MIHKLFEKNKIIILLIVAILIGIATETIAVNETTSTDYRYSEEAFKKVQKNYPEFLGLASKGTIPIPGLEKTIIDGEVCTDMVPQGICVFNGNYILVTAYSYSKKYKSVIYVIEKETGNYVKTLVLPDINHVGGIAVSGDGNVWIAKSSDKCLSMIEGSKILNAIDDSSEESENIKYDIKNVDCGCTASFVTEYSGYIWVGVFNDGDDEEPAMLHGFEYKEVKEKDKNGKTIITKKLVPYIDIKIPNNANGACFTSFNSKTYLAVNLSHGRDNSSNIYYAEVDIDEGTVYREFDEITVPPMAEEMCIADTNVYYMFESAATEYSTKANKCPDVVDRICISDIKDLFYWEKENDTFEGVYNNLKYKAEKYTKEITITGTTNPNNKKMDIPEEIDGYKVTVVSPEPWNDELSEDHLEEVNISSNVKYIYLGQYHEKGGYGHPNKLNLKAINVNKNNKKYSSIDGVLFNKQQNELLEYPIAKENNEYNIPKGVTKIRDGTFRNCDSLGIVRIPDGVTDIGECAFYNCQGLYNVVIPNSVTKIGRNAFQACIALSDIYLPNKLEIINEYTFDCCYNMTNIKIPYNVKIIKEGAFEDCLNLKTVTISNGTERIEDSAFYECKNLEKIVIPKSVEYIGKDVFNFCNSFTIYGYKDTYAENYAKENGYTFKLLDSEDEIKKGNFKCVDTTFSDEFGFRYTDDYFRNRASEYNQHLATMSLCLAYSAYNTNSSPYNRDEEYKNNKVDSNVRDLFKDCDFNMEQYNQYNYYVKPTMDDVACAIVNKKIDNTTLIAIAVRGGGYEKEWGNNFTVFNEGDHSGFKSSADKVYERLQQYIKFWNIKGNIKIWVTGFSRAGAVSNLLAAKLNDSSCIQGTYYDTKEDVYAYCFATPAGADVSNKPNSEKYSNIYSIVHYDDPVPLVAPAYWGFDRYGSTLVFPFKESLKGASTYENNMLKRLDQMGVDEYKIKNFRDMYYPINQDSLGTFLRKFVKSARKNITINKDLGPIKPLDTRKKFWSSGLQDNLRSTFNDAYKPYEKLELIDIVKIFWKEITSETILNMSQIETATNNLGILVIAHAEPAYYLSWMQSMDSYYVEGATQKFSNGSGRLLYINCPVDVYVYDSSNKLVAAIENEAPKKIEGDSIIASIDENGQKVIYLPHDENYTIKTKAREDCKTSIAIDEYVGVATDVSKIIGYSEIEMKKNEELIATATKYTENNEENSLDSGATYTLKKANKELTPDIQIENDKIDKNTFEIETKYDTLQGTVTGGGNFTIGSFCKITAKANEEYKFDGWYINNKKISDEEEYRFAVKESLQIEAKFSQNALLGDIDNDGEITAFDAYTALGLSLSGDDLTSAQVYVLDIDKDGQVTSFDAYLILSYSVGIVDTNYWK